MCFEGGTPRDFIHLAVNETFELQTGLKDSVGRRITEVMPGIRLSDPLLIETCGRVALTGRPERFEMFFQSLQEWNGALDEGYNSSTSRSPCLTWPPRCATYSVASKAGSKALALVRDSGYFSPLPPTESPGALTPVSSPKAS